VALALAAGGARFLLAPASIWVAIAFHMTLLAIYAIGVWLLVIPVADRVDALSMLRDRLLISRGVNVAASGAD
jgi:uncharacterized membrane protein YhiD involved in acid resistance